MLSVVLRPVDRLLTPVEVEVDKLVTLLLVVLSPVLTEESPVLTLLRPVEVEVDRLVTLLFVVLRPVRQAADIAIGRAQARAQRRDAGAHG